MAAFGHPEKVSEWLILGRADSPLSFCHFGERTATASEFIQCLSNQANPESLQTKKVEDKCCDKKNVT
jgi:hypothetical protein